MSSRDRLPVVDDLVITPRKRSYRLVEILGEGGYGCVFRAQCEEDGLPVALKAEKYSGTVLRSEISVLKEANKRGCTQICQLMDYGNVDKEFMFVVMSMLGPDLSKLRNTRIDRCFSLGTNIRVAQQTLSAVKELHSCGFISRDIKPGNFAVGSPEAHEHRTIFIFDFGLARRYIDHNWNILPSRGEIGFRGTTRYASLRAHKSQDLGRRDDMESWLYMTVELTRGALPWRLVSDRSLVLASKKDIRAGARREFFIKCPAEYDTLMAVIDSLDFGSAPPYATILDILQKVQMTSRISWDMPYDWEREDSLPPSEESPVVREISPPKVEKSHRLERMGGNRDAHC